MPNVRSPEPASDAYPRLGGVRMSDRVAAELQRRILRGEPGSGERLPTEAELCELFGVSRSVIRDALRTLGARGLVRVGAGQGIVVTDPSNEAFGEALVLMLARSGLTMREVTEARAAIEIHLGPLALDRGTEEDWAQLGSHLRSFAEAVDNGDWQGAHRGHLEFHLTLLHAAHSPALEIMLAPMNEITLMSSIPPANTPELWEVGLHEPILEAFRSGDAAAARSSLDEHFDSFMNDERYAAFEATPFREAGTEALRRLTGEDGDLGRPAMTR